MFALSSLDNTMERFHKAHWTIVDDIQQSRFRTWPILGWSMPVILILVIGLYLVVLPLYLYQKLI
jgi:hypothetical protein